MKLDGKQGTGKVGFDLPISLLAEVLGLEDGGTRSMRSIWSTSIMLIILTACVQGVETGAEAVIALSDITGLVQPRKEKVDAT